MLLRNNKNIFSMNTVVEYVNKDADVSDGRIIFRLLVP